MSLVNRSKAAQAVKLLLEAIEGEPLRPELMETPHRVQRALEELLDGYSVDIDSLFKTFDGEGQDQIIVVRDISFVSFCEHHFLPFSGKAHVAYLPVSKVMGLSKIPTQGILWASQKTLRWPRYIPRRSKGRLSTGSRV